MKFDGKQCLVPYELGTMSTMFGYHPFSDTPVWLQYLSAWCPSHVHTTMAGFDPENLRILS
jgi:hypothetical protein